MLSQCNSISKDLFSSQEFTNILLAIITLILGVLAGFWGNFYWSRNYGKSKKKLAKQERFSRIITTPLSEFGFSYRQLYDFLFEHHSRDLQEQNGQYKIADLSYFNGLLNGIVDVLHPEDYRFPLVFQPNWVRSNNPNFGVELGGLIPSRAYQHDLAKEGRKYLKENFEIDSFTKFLKESSGKVIENGRTFDLVYIENCGNTAKLHCCEGNYFNFIESYELIQKELLYNCIEHNRHFPLRDLINFKDVQNYTLRPAKIGINVFTIMKRTDGGYSTFIHERSAKVAEYPNVWHVIPAGTFQPVSGHRLKEQYSLIFTVFRELLEEMFDLEKTDKKYQESDPLKIFSLDIPGGQKPGTMLLGDPPNLISFENDKFQLVTTALLIDISSFKPELTFALYIKDSAIHEQLKNHIKGNWEGTIGEYDLTSITGEKSSGKLKDFLQENLTVNRFLPAGAIAVAEGIKYFNEFLNPV